MRMVEYKVWWKSMRYWLEVLSGLSDYVFLMDYGQMERALPVKLLYKICRHLPTESYIHFRS
jgi:hypothetical protein